MDFVDQVKAFAATVPSKLDNTKTEQATKSFLVMPFIQQVLGYDVFDPNELMPEFDANVGASSNYKLDFAILREGKPVILIECKCYGNDLDSGKEWSQLYHYFVATDARIGVLTNGIIYRFYADLEKSNKMDKTPFLELNLLNLNDSLIVELKKLNKSSFNIDEALTAATELKYVGGIKSVLRRQLREPDEDFVRIFFKELCSENIFTGRLKEEFLGFTKTALKEFIREQIDILLDEAANRTQAQPENGSETEGQVQDLPPDKQLEFTEDEREGLYVVKSILCQNVDPKRVTHRDTTNYCNILLDDNGRKPIVRLWFNNPQKRRLELFTRNEEGEKSSEMVSIGEVNELYNFSESLKSVVTAYDSKEKQ